MYNLSDEPCTPTESPESLRFQDARISFPEVPRKHVIHRFGAAGLERPIRDRHRNGRQTNTSPPDVRRPLPRSFPFESFRIIPSRSESFRVVPSSGQDILNIPNCGLSPLTSHPSQRLPNRVNDYHPSWPGIQLTRHVQQPD